jgi:hypothetical protein
MLRFGLSVNDLPDGLGHRPYKAPTVECGCEHY